LWLQDYWYANHTWWFESAFEARAGHNSRKFKILEADGDITSIRKGGRVIDVSVQIFTNNHLERILIGYQMLKQIRLRLKIKWDRKNVWGN
jgi:hypothetical protein